MSAARIEAVVVEQPSAGALELMEPTSAAPEPGEASSCRAIAAGIVGWAVDPWRVEPFQVQAASSSLKRNS